METTAVPLSKTMETLSQLQKNIFTNEDDILNLPRRRGHTRREEATSMAQLLFPDFSPTKALIHYDSLIQAAKAHVKAERHRRQLENRIRDNKKGKILAVQGPWQGQELDPVDLNGPKAIPMPVKIGSEAEFKPIFNFLADNTDPRDMLLRDACPNVPKRTTELNWDTPCLEFPRGIIYEDGRLDLCKMVVGPTHIESLMSTLENNHHITQFLLGNNVIATTGAKAIARFIEQYPNRIETWYLAGCHITTTAFTSLVSSMLKSNSITNVWLKRNPLGQSSIPDLARLIENSPHLRTLDLENTELGDSGITRLFELLEGKEVALRNLYLNANGMGISASKSLANFLTHPSTKLESLFISSNPIGESGIIHLASAIATSRTLKRLSLASCGITSAGAILLVDAVRKGESVMSLDIGASQTTKPHKQRFNHISDAAVPAINKMICGSPHLRCLNLGHTAISSPNLNILRSSVENSSLVWFNIFRIKPQAAKLLATETMTPSCPLAFRQALMRNVEMFYPVYKGKKYSDFESGEECRFLRNSPDVRLIDSMYRTRNRRMGVVEDSVWEVGDETWQVVERDVEKYALNAETS